MIDSASLQIALFTGQSDRSRWALSPMQHEFLESVCGPQLVRIGCNFPYFTNSPAYRRTALPIACVSNTLQYFQSRFAFFREWHAPAVETLISGRARTIFITGSCGLELFNNLGLSLQSLTRIGIFAVGPVARSRPACRHILIGSPGDAISRLFFPKPDRWVDCGHMEYLSNQSVRELCRNFIGGLR
jgi:hypothetical protein